MCVCVCVSVCVSVCVLTYTHKYKCTYMLKQGVQSVHHSQPFYPLLLPAPQKMRFVTPLPTCIPFRGFGAKTKNIIYVATTHIKLP